MLNARVLLLLLFLLRCSSSFICMRLFTNHISFLYCLQTIRILLTYDMSCSLIFCRWFFTCLVRHKLFILQSTLKTFFFFTYSALNFRSFFFFYKMLFFLSSPRACNQNCKTLWHKSIVSQRNNCLRIFLW